MIQEPGLLFRDRRAFQRQARALIRLPEPGEAHLAHLLPEAKWQALLSQVSDPGEWLLALSQATGVYFFPSREWAPRLVRFLKLLRVRRLLEAGAGRGYLTAALGPLAEAAGLAFLAIDKGEGEYQAGLTVHLLVRPGDVFQVAPEFRPEAALYAWPPPGQSLASLLAFPFLRYLIIVGESGGGVTGAREDWERLAHKKSPALSRFSRGRTGPDRHQVTIFETVAKGY